MQQGAATQSFLAKIEFMHNPPPKKKRRKNNPSSVITMYQGAKKWHAFDKNRSMSDEKRAWLRDLEQNTPAWAIEITKAQGASSSSCAVGLGPATPFHYYQLKTHRIARETSDTMQAIFQRGHVLEDEAAKAYEVLMETKLETVGIVVHPRFNWIQCSPDRLITGNSKGIVEIKCPIYCLPSKIKDQYMCQVQLQMACTGADWCDLFAYYVRDEPDPPSFQGAKCWRIWRSDAYWAVMLECLDAFADCLMLDRPPTTTEIPLRPSMPQVYVDPPLVWDFSEPLCVV